MQKREEAQTALGMEGDGEGTQPQYRESWTEEYFGKTAETRELAVLEEGSDNALWLEHPYWEGVPITGTLVAAEKEGGGMMMWILTEDGQGTLEYIYHTDGGSCYISCRGIKERGMDLPRYVMQPQSISCQPMQLGWQEDRAWETAAEDGEGTGWTEYYVLDGRPYLVDHGEKTMAGNVPAMERYVLQWIQGEARRVAGEMEKGKEKPAGLENCLKGEYACQDFNRDGAMDYVAAIPEKDGQRLWLLLSQPDGRYRHKALTEGGNFFCKELGISREGMLLCENSYYREDRQDYFKYDSLEEDFYFVGTLQWGYGCAWKDSSSTLGEFTIGEYYKEAYWPTTRWRLAVEGRAEEELLVGRIQDDIRGKGDVGILYAIEKYADEKIYSTVISGKGFLVPVLVDRKSGELIDPAGLLSKEELLRICREGLKDLHGNWVGLEEKVAFMESVEAGYDRINSLAYTSKMEEGQPRVACYLTAWGMNIVCIREPEEGKEGRQENEVLIYMVEKEYFMDTPLWGYMEPAGYLGEG